MKQERGRGPAQILVLLYRQRQCPAEGMCPCTGLVVKVAAAADHTGSPTAENSPPPPIIMAAHGKSNSRVSSRDEIRGVKVDSPEVHVSALGSDFSV